MKMSQLFGRTLRDQPSEADLISHVLLLQAGMIHQVSTGVYSYLPLAWKSIKKIESIIREEMDFAGAQEVKLGILQNREIWKQSGRDEIYGPDMLRLKDRRERELALPPTNEELITETVKSVVQSYNDLPFILYQIQTKFRDEPRPRGGLIRVREFDMMDAYSFDADEDGLDLNYQKMISAYTKSFERCGINTVIVDADSGAIGGKVGGFISGLFKRQAGGPVSRGQSYLVGEKGPEIFVPSTSGTIIPNDRVGGGVTNNIVVNVDASGSSVEGNEQESRELGLVLSAAIQAQLVQEKRPGGLLA